MAKLQDLIGQRFTRLMVISLHSVGGGATKWNCLCDCGNPKAVAASHLKAGKTLSCGCLSKEMSTARATTHGRTGTHLHNLWIGIKRRTQDKDSPHYKNYRGRGIGVHPGWLDSFEAFEAYILANLGERPEGKSLDRRDNDKGYEPGNLRWATRSEQNRNTRVNVYINYDGEKVLQEDLALRLGISPSTIIKRLREGKLRHFEVNLTGSSSNFRKGRLT